MYAQIRVFGKSRLTYHSLKFDNLKYERKYFVC